MPRRFVALLLMYVGYVGHLVIGVRALLPDEDHGT